MGVVCTAQQAARYVPSFIIGFWPEETRKKSAIFHVPARISEEGRAPSYFEWGHASSSLLLSSLELSDIQVYEP